MKNQHHGMKALNGLPDLCTAGRMRSNKFGRMLPGASPLYIDPDALSAIGAADGPMKATGAAKKTDNIPVAHVFFGQFIDHDITLDLISSFDSVNVANEIENFRTPTLDLDCIYGDGPEGSPFLYYHDQPAFNGQKLITGADKDGTTPEEQGDLARTSHGRAIIGDPRNDENRIISQLQLRMILFHNRVIDELHGNVDDGELFEAARETVTRHYQWVVLHDFLKAMVGKPLIDDILGSGRKLYQPEHCDFNAAYGHSPFIPVEFSVAAYRFGHSMVPQRIQIRPGEPAFDLFGPTLGLGFKPVKDIKEIVHWPQLLDLSDNTVDRTDQLDVMMAKDLLELPFVGDGDEQSLATRNLKRGQAFRLPSGEFVASLCDRSETEIGRVTTAAKKLAKDAGHEGALDAGTPLWLYILLEASKTGQETSPGTFKKGEGLGPVGGRIVAETMIGILELDDHSILGGNRNWSPQSVPLKPGGLHTLLDILTF